MEEVRRAIVQCYVKEPLLYHFTVCEVQKGMRCQSNWSAMTSCPGWFSLRDEPSPLCPNFTQKRGHGDEKKRRRRSRGATIGKYGPPSQRRIRSVEVLLLRLLFSFSKTAYRRGLIHQGCQGRGPVGGAANALPPLKIHIQSRLNHSLDKQSEWNKSESFCFGANRVNSALRF